MIEEIKIKGQIFYFNYTKPGTVEINDENGAVTSLINNL